MEPFELVLFEQNLQAPGTRITATSQPVTAGKLFVVEHISGFFETGVGNNVEQIVVIGRLAEQEVFLPTHFSSILGRAIGRPSVQKHQFGSPVKMYVRGGDTITIQCDATYSVTVKAIAMGHLVEL